MYTDNGITYQNGFYGWEPMDDRWGCERCLTVEGCECCEACDSHPDDCECND